MSNEGELGKRAVCFSLPIYTLCDKKHKKWFAINLGIAKQFLEVI